jgi:glycosyltransferase involved in cell wall biosynthesis
MINQIRLLMVTSEWPTPDHPHYVPFLVRQVEFLRRAGVAVDVFSFRGAKKPVNYLKAWNRLRRQLKNGQYDLLHAQFGQSAILPWPKRLPLVVTFHGCDIQGVKGSDGHPTLAGRILQRLCQLIATRADAVIAVSERLRSFVPAAVPVSVIPLGLDFDLVPAVSQQEARRQLGLPLTERLVLFVGNPEETVKRYGLAQQAVEILNQTLSATLITGWGKPNKQILLMMIACDVLVLTSIQEGSPTVVKEALACNLPVVSLDVGDVRQRLNGIAGCEVCADDQPHTIAASLERVLRNGARIRGREEVQDLDEKLITEKVIRIYQSVLTRSARNKAVGAKLHRPTAGKQAARQPNNLFPPELNPYE